jgi:hypothetical protein
LAEGDDGAVAVAGALDCVDEGAEAGVDACFGAAGLAVAVAVAFGVAAEPVGAGDFVVAAGEGLGAGAAVAGVAQVSASANGRQSAAPVRSLWVLIVFTITPEGSGQRSRSPPYVGKE